jgi:hypothetical protein
MKTIKNRINNYMERKALNYIAKVNKAFYPENPNDDDNEHQPMNYK